ncbi:hypothetical protein DCS_00178 [Drechmeria coniospora]|uniref:Uncharacterized protein n=1 Tax=Drechmeria coniospora TaxID=98403 RepID=A0A151GPQ4_DRECN|nr:hypothetical protein DCS_00178 [Drechmeria coniospora]KYK59051.1 hypothetical protein DCS_00178 [Drechmeria coniospora]
MATLDWRAVVSTSLAWSPTSAAESTTSIVERHVERRVERSFRPRGHAAYNAFTFLPRPRPRLYRRPSITNWAMVIFSDVVTVDERASTRASLAASSGPFSPPPPPPHQGPPGRASPSSSTPSCSSVPIFGMRRMALTISSLCACRCKRYGKCPLRLWHVEAVRDAQCRPAISVRLTKLGGPWLAQAHEPIVAMPLFAVALGLLVGIGFRRGQGTDPERGSVHGWPRCARGDDGWASLYPGPKPKRQPPGGPDDEENSGNGRKWASKVNLVLSCRRMPCEASECASGFRVQTRGAINSEFKHAPLDRTHHLGHG